jgi:hypothetical protein
MTLSDFHDITDELLSAYIDDEVTEQERSLVEKAIAADEVIAWRVDSLRQTVTMLQDLPELAMPRSFTLSFEQLNTIQSDGQRAGVAAGQFPGEQSPVQQRQGAGPLSRSGASLGGSPGFWDQLQQGWREFWQAGNPLLRNAAAVSFALMIMLTSGGPVLVRAFMQPVGQGGEMSASAPAAAPAADVVALVPAVTEAVQAAIQKSPNESAQSQKADAAGKQEADEAESSESMNIRQDDPTEESAEESAEEAAPVEDTASESAVTEGESAVAEADSATGPEATGERVAPQSSAATAMIAPPPGMGGGSGVEGRGGDGMGAMGGGAEVGPEFGGQDMLVPPGAYTYDEAPVLQQTPVPAEEAVGASVAAVPEDERVAVATEAANETTARIAEPESSVAQPTQSESVPSESVPPESSTSDSALSDASVSEQPTVEPTVDPTAAAVVLLAPEEITSSNVVQDASLDSTAIVTTGARNLPLLWVAQGGTLLLTIMLSSLWWRSRRPRRLG